MSNIFDSLWKLLGSLSTGMVFYTLVSLLSTDPIVQMAGSAFGIAVGAMIAFIIIPTFIEGDFFIGALSVGLLLSLTYTFSTPLIHDLIINNELKNHYPKYEKNEKWLESKTYKSSTIIDTNADNLKLVRLKAEYEKKEVTIDAEKIKKEVYQEFYNMKHNNKKRYKKYYTNKSLEYGCTVLKFDPLIKCVQEGKILEADKEANRGLAPLRKKIHALSEKIKVTEKQNRENKNKSSELNDEINVKLNENKAMRKKAIENSISAVTIGFVLWAFGIVIEVGFIGFKMITIVIHRRKEKRELVAKKTKKADELKLDEVQGFRSFDIETDWIIGYANNDSHEFRPHLAWKRGKGVRVGTTIALSNAIMGAFLYTLTKRKVNTWSDLAISNILEVNGLIGEEKIKTYRSMCFRDVRVLGSTSRNLKISKVENGVKFLQAYNPQQLAIDFLVAHERSGYSIEELTIQKMKELAVAFVKEIYPLQFD